MAREWRPRRSAHLNLATQGAKGNRVTERRHRRNLVLERTSRLSRHHAPTVAPAGSRASPPDADLLRRARTDIRTQSHAARRQQRYTGDDAVLRRIAMPADRSAGGYSLISAIANVVASTFAHCAILTRIGNRNAGSGGDTRPASHEWPKNATRRRATTPRISNVENSICEMSSTSAVSSSGVTKFGR